MTLINEAVPRSTFIATITLLAMLFSDVYDITIVNYNIVIEYTKSYVLKKSLATTAVLSVINIFWVWSLMNIESKFSLFVWSIPILMFGAILYNYIKEMRNRMVIELDLVNKRINVQNKEEYDNSTLEYLRIDYRADRSGYMNHYLAFIDEYGKAFTIVKGQGVLFMSVNQELRLLAEKISEHTGMPIKSK